MYTHCERTTRTNERKGCLAERHRSRFKQAIASRIAIQQQQTLRKTDTHAHDQSVISQTVVVEPTYLPTCDRCTAQELQLRCVMSRMCAMSAVASRSSTARMRLPRAARRIPNSLDMSRTLSTVVVDNMCTRHGERTHNTHHHHNNNRTVGRLLSSQHVCSPTLIHELARTSSKRTSTRGGHKDSTPTDDVHHQPEIRGLCKAMQRFHPPQRTVRTFRSAVELTQRLEHRKCWEFYATRRGCFLVVERIVGRFETTFCSCNIDWPLHASVRGGGRHQRRL